MATPPRDPPAPEDDPAESLPPAPASGPHLAVPDEPSAASLPLPPPPASSNRAVSAAANDVAQPFDPGLSRVVKALLAFVGSKDRDKGRAFIHGVVLHKLYGKKRKNVDADLVDELTQQAVVRALQAREPPWTEWGIPGWVARVAKRTIADYFRTREPDEEWLEPGVEVAELPFERHGPHTDWGAREHLIAKYVEGLIGHDERKKQTFRLMMEKEVVGRSVEDLAAEQGTTPNALSLRFAKLRKELYPHVSIMDEEKPRRTILVVFLLFLFGAAVAAAIVLLGLLAQPRLAPTPEPPALPSATAAPSPSLDIAEPPGPEDDAGSLEPGPPRKVPPGNPQGPRPSPNP